MKDLCLLTSKEIEKTRNSFSLSFKEGREEIDTFIMSIDSDPSRKSPEVLYKKMHMAREYTNRAGAVFFKFTKAYFLTSKVLVEKEERFKLKINDEIKKHCSDPTYTKFRSTDEKIRYSESFVPESCREEIIQFRSLAYECKSYFSYMKMRFDTIKDVKSDILTQLGILKSMISLKDLNSGVSISPEEKSFTEDGTDFDSDSIFPDGAKGFGQEGVNNF